MANPDPAVVLDLIQAFRSSKVMFAAVALGVFDALAAGAKPLAALAEASKADPGALERLLDACVGLGLLARDGRAYCNTPAASAYLCKASPQRLTGYINYSNVVLWKLWGNLEDAVREGTHRWKQTYGREGSIFANLFDTEEAKREFLMGMHGQGLLSSPEVVAGFDLSSFRTLVDLGGATGHLAIAACERYPQMRAVVFDRGDVVELAREVVEASAPRDRIDVVAGDFFEDRLPSGDLYALGRILHDWTAEKIEKLLGRVFEHLPAGGAVLIAEKLLADDRNGPPWALLQNLNMLVCTEGKERTLSDYEALLKKAGFDAVRAQSTSAPLDAILAVKR